MNNEIYRPNIQKNYTRFLPQQYPPVYLTVYPRRVSYFCDGVHLSFSFLYAHKICFASKCLEWSMDKLIDSKAVLKRFKAGLWLGAMLLHCWGIGLRMLCKIDDSMPFSFWTSLRGNRSRRLNWKLFDCRLLADKLIMVAAMCWLWGDRGNVIARTI